MWTTLSVSRWICLLTLAVVMLSTVLKVNSMSVHIPCSCDGNLTSRKINVIKKCYEQMPRPDCNHAFVITNKRGQFCIKPDASWLQTKIKTDKLHCPPDLSV